MAEYIKREAALRIVKNYGKSAIESGRKTLDPSDDIISLATGIDLIPAEDVVEVKHGEWIDRYNNKYANHLYICSVCGGEALYEFYANELGQTKERQALTVGCPHCLAKMDKRSEENG